MKDASDLIEGIYRICEWIMRFSVTNMLWVVFNLPIAFLVLNIYFIGHTEYLMFSIIPLIIMLPFLYFPATAAMFASARDWVMKEENTSIRQYWSYYLENYKKSMLGGLILTGVWTVWGVDYYYFSQENVVLTFIFLVMGVILFVFTINFFSMLSHYEMKLPKIMKNTLIITLGCPILFLTILISSGILLYMSLNGFEFLFIFFTGSLISYLSFSAFYRFYLKMTA